MAGKWWEAAPVVEADPQQGGGVILSDPYQERGDRRDEARTGLAVEGNARDASRLQNDVENRRAQLLITQADKYNRDPTIAGYRESLGNFATGLRTSPTPQGDNALITAYVKVFDPGSVVNEGEREGAASGQGYLASQIEAAKRNFGMDGAGLFTPEARKRIRAEMANIMGKRVKSYNERRAYYEKQSSDIGLDPSLVVGGHDAAPFVEQFREYDRENGLGEFAQRREGGAIPGATADNIAFDIDTGQGAFGSQLQADRLTPAQQGALDAFLKANAGNPNFGPDQLGAFYQSIGVQGTVPSSPEFFDAVRSGKAFDTTADPTAADAEIKRRAMEASYAEIPEGGDVSAAGRDKGLLLNMTDELRGGIGGIKSLFRGEGFGSGYQQERDIERALQERSRQENGVIPELIGGLMTPAGIISRANMARDAAAMGAIAGFGEGEGAADSLGKAATGAGLGYGAAKGIEAAAPIVANSAIGQKAKDFFTRAPDTAAQDFAAAAERQGLDYLPADIPGATKTQFATSVSKATLGGVPLADAAKKIRDTAQAAKDRIANAVGKPAKDAAGAGQATRRGMEAWERQTEGRGGELFDAIPIPAKTEVSAENTRAALAEITQGMDSNPELSRLWTENPRMKATLVALTPRDVASEGAEELAAAQGRLASAKDDVAAAQSRLAASEDLQRTLLQGSGSQWGASGAEIAAARREAQSAEAALAEATKRVNTESAAVSAATKKAASPPEGGKISWEDMRRLRTIVGKITGKPSLTSDGAADDAMRKFYGALTRDIEQAAAAHSPEAAKAFSRANAYWRGRSDRIESVMVALLGRKGDASADSTFQQIERWASFKGGDFSKLARAIRSLPPEEASTVRATIIDRLGDANPGSQGAANDSFSADTFLTHWSKLSDRAKAILFQGEHRKALDDLATVFEGSKFSRGFDNNSRTGLVGSQFATGAMTVAQPLTGAALAGLQLAGGKLLSSPRVARWLVALTKKPNPSAQLAHIGQLTAIARSEPIIANDIFTLQQRLADAFAQPASLRSAAEENDDLGNPKVREGERNNAQ